jgi:hypothetical protein
VPGELVPATAILGWGLFAIALIDQRHFIIPNALSLPWASSDCSCRSPGTRPPSASPPPAPCWVICCSA